jgi:hypothetical protein
MFSIASLAIVNKNDALSVKNNLPTIYMQNNVNNKNPYLWLLKYLLSVYAHF